MEREDWGSLAAFAVVADERSFTRAAARLGVSASALSHSMRRLEERLRIQLLARSTRSVSTTEAGERLLARLGPAIEEISNAVDDEVRLLDRPSGHVRITASRSAARMVVAPLIPRFTRSYPDVVVECLINPALTNIVAQRFDAGIRLGESLEKDVVAVPVTGQLRMAVVGAPQYFASHPAPSTPHDLRMHRCINFRLPSTGTLYKWEFGKGHHSVEVAVRRYFRLARCRGCSRIGVHRFPASFSITPVGASCRLHPRRSSMQSESPPSPLTAVDCPRRLEEMRSCKPDDGHNIQADDRSRCIPLR